MGLPGWLGVLVGLIGVFIAILLALKERREGDPDWRWSATLVGVSVLEITLVVWQGLEGAAADAESGKKIAQAQATADKATKRGDRLQEENDRFRETLRPRALTDKQKIEIHNALFDFPRGKIVLGIMMESGPEASQYAEAIGRFFAEEGYTVERALLPGFHAGLSIAVASPDNPPPHAGPIQEALKDAGVEANWTVAPDGPDDAVQIFVGQKQLPPDGIAPAPAG